MNIINFGQRDWLSLLSDLISLISIIGIGVLILIDIKYNSRNVDQSNSSANTSEKTEQWKSVMGGFYKSYTKKKSDNIIKISTKSESTEEIAVNFRKEGKGDV